MNIKNISLSFFVAIVCTAFIPLQTQAYFTTAQTETKFTNTTALYTIEYAFGLTDEDIYMPIIAESNIAWKSDEQKVGYEIYNQDDEVIKNPATAAIVLSNAPIVDGMYKIERGSAQKMTLLVIFKSDGQIPGDSYRLQVTQLPFFVDIGEDDLEMRQLNPSELQYYATEEVELNS